MKDSKHWLACLDLSNMDEILIGYSAFLTSVVKPKTITFFHTVESGPTALEIVEQFPEIETEEEFLDLIRGELKEKVEGHFDDDSIEIRIVIKQGKPTDQIIDLANSLEPDLILMGKKIGYAGEGVVPRRILKYVSSSILFVPENSRYNLEKVLVPVDFSEQSAKSVQTAKALVNDENVTAQHIYRYRAQFFPYTLSDEEKREVDSKIEKKMQKFINENGISDKVNFVLTLHKKGKVADEVYNQVVKDQVDFIIVSSKSKKLSSIVGHDFTDKMVDYAFGVPLLVQKNKEKHRKFLKSLFGD
ncbi:universal stress protein [Rhodohalobacter halophilus]|uniref:universal stress protein n=1 Tax=Rhodohalobacter halophilus TaxID=1812810 RepID=UPI00083F6393|nr:universal stress protein [Rhodohalobacter halophilus]